MGSKPLIVLFEEKQTEKECNEIWTIMYKYLKIVNATKNNSFISLYCDSCAGQVTTKENSNAMISYFLKGAIFIKEITISYHLQGHTMMPMDTVHATIESFIRRRVIWAASELTQKITMQL